MKKIILLGALILHTTLNCHSITKENVEINPGLSHYAMHTLTNGVAIIPIALTAGIGAGLGIFLLSEAEARNNTQLRFMAAVIGLSGVLGAGYTFYRIPQWTDTYCLDYKTTRSTKKNIISALVRILLSYPLGVWVSEFALHQEKYLETT